MKKKRVSREERRKALQERTITNINNIEGSNSGNYALNFQGQDVKFFKPKKGRIKIDILPYIIETKNDPSGMKPGFENYVLEYYIHRNVGPEEKTIVCLRKTFNKPCPICEELQTLKNEGVSKEEQEALKPKQRCLYNIIDKSNEDDGIQLFDVSYHLFEKELREEAQSSEDGELVTFSDLEEGATIKCRASEVTKGGYTFMEYKSFDFIEREPYSEDILDETYSLDKYLNVLTYEQIRDAFHGIEIKDEDRYEDDSPFNEDEIEDDVENIDDEEEENVKNKKVSKEKTKKKIEKKEKKEKVNKCPHGGEFAVDCDELEDCEDCAKWEECADAQEELND